MITIKLSTKVPSWRWLRQTPGSKGVWGNCRFVADSNLQECDYWVVCDGLPGEETALCPKENTILITGEPAAIKGYDKEYLSQFGCVITTQRKISHRNVIHSQTALPWFVGLQLVRTPGNRDIWKDEVRLDYDRLRSMRAPKKDKLISVLISSKAKRKGHRKRTVFVKRLQSEFKGEIDVFISEINGPEDKWDVISNYKYHIAIENCSCPDYFSEKLLDAFLGMTYPIYYGCTNLNKYFPESSFARIDINDWETSIDTIRKVIREDRFASSEAERMTAKDLVLDEYNLFPMISRLVEGGTIHGRPERLVLKPEKKRPYRPWTPLMQYAEVRSKC